MSSAAKIKVRPTGATATLGRTGFPHVVSETGGVIDIRTGAAEAGFNPLDLLYASLSACLAMSARIAASRLGVLDRLTHVSVRVSGSKAPDEPSRIAGFNVEFEIAGDFDEAMRGEIARLAEDEICTVSNTIKGQPDFTVTVAGADGYHDAGT
ncbi:OsmC family protein [Ciceribacter ferrooxidans]|uniref:OsmC family peroxiredoxin n=1 Tax=Ciceribacter ferrooxidans TaxID=2509717 RepID=A0A4Q2SGY6_9HYPH|nr:OsmC family protein [Ciceribacter ferrooxidans]RYC04696.1 OsmC family peroxiredoxin [Ciceribacter ferrooxidans]